MNILFINANLYGHINPTLALTKALTQRGHQVDYYCAASFTPQIEQAGAHRIGFSEKIEQFLQAYRPTDRHPFFMLLEYMLCYDEAVLPELLELVHTNSYDMILCDSIFGAGAFLQRMVDIPVVCSHSSFAMSHAPVPDRMLVPGFHPQLDQCYTILARICERYGLQAPTLNKIFVSKGDLNVVYTTPSFNADPKITEPDYLFAGPALQRAQQSDNLDLTAVQGKLLYISLGSLNTDHLDFYKMCLSAFGDTAYTVYMSIGRKCDVAQLGTLPANFVVHSFLPQMAILRRADAFITHAGFNSVNEALTFGVPMLALPQVNDQHMVANRLTSLHLGLMEPFAELTPQILSSDVLTLLTDPLIKENCMKFSREMQQFAGLEQAVQKLERFADVWEGGERAWH